MATHDTDGLIMALERGPALLIPLIREVPVANLKRRPAPEKWSAHEHACHLTIPHGLFLDRLERMLKEDNPMIKAYLPEDEKPDELVKMDLDVALARYARERGEIVEKLRALTPAQWERTGRHSEFSQYSVFIAFRHLFLHDMLHAYRIEDLAFKRDW